MTSLERNGTREPFFLSRTSLSVEAEQAASNAEEFRSGIVRLFPRRKFNSHGLRDVNKPVSDRVAVEGVSTSGEG